MRSSTATIATYRRSASLTRSLLLRWRSMWASQTSSSSSTMSKTCWRTTACSTCRFAGRRAVHQLSCCAVIATPHSLPDPRENVAFPCAGGRVAQGIKLGGHPVGLVHVSVHIPRRRRVDSALLVRVAAARLASHKAATQSRCGRCRDCPRCDEHCRDEHCRDEHCHDERYCDEHCRDENSSATTAVAIT